MPYKTSFLFKDIANHIKDQNSDKDNFKTKFFITIKFHEEMEVTEEIVNFIENLLLAFPFPNNISFNNTNIINNTFLNESLREPNGKENNNFLLICPHYGLNSNFVNHLHIIYMHKDIISHKQLYNEITVKFQDIRIDVQIKILKNNSLETTIRYCFKDYEFNSFTKSINNENETLEKQNKLIELTRFILPIQTKTIILRTLLKNFIMQDTAFNAAFLNYEKIEKEKNNQNKNITNELINIYTNKLKPFIMPF